MGLCHRCKIHRGDNVHVVKFIGGGLCLHSKIQGGSMSTNTKMSRGVCPGDFVLHSAE